MSKPIRKAILKELSCIQAKRLELYPPYSIINHDNVCPGCFHINTTPGVRKYRGLSHKNATRKDVFSSGVLMWLMMSCDKHSVSINFGVFVSLIVTCTSVSRTNTTDRLELSETFLKESLKIP